jgi:hypothetical protein
MSKKGAPSRRSVESSARDSIAEASVFRQCTKCGESKPLTEYYAHGYCLENGQQARKYDAKCADCNRAESKIKNRKYERKRKAEAKQERKLASLANSFLGVRL